MTPSGHTGVQFNKKSKEKSNNGNKHTIKKDNNNNLVNWEGSVVSDGERFSQQSKGTNGNTKLKSFDVYLKRKEIRALAKKKSKTQKEETSSRYTNWH